MTISDPKNMLMGTPMGPLDGLVPPNPLVGQAMNMQPQQPVMPQMSPQASQQPAQMSGARPSIDQATWDQQMGALDGIGGLIADLLGKPEITKKMVINSMADAVGKGFVTPQAAAKEIGSLPDDPGQIRQILTQQFIKNTMLSRQIYQMKPMVPPNG